MADEHQAAPQSRATFPGDKFLKVVFAGCINVGKSRNNPIRGNLVATGLREAFGHILHKLSPDHQVRACVWFVQARDTATVTRAQRVSYIIKAGLTDDFVRNELGLDVKASADELTAMVEGLNKATHVRPNTILTHGPTIRQLFIDVVTGLDALLDAAQDSRRMVEEAVGVVLHNAVFEKLIGEAIQELDELSTHTTIDYHMIDRIEVEKMDAATISYLVTGEAAVELQFGSGSDVRNDIGYMERDSYPYEARAEVPITEPLAITANDVEVKVDTDSYYE
ncbi:hypothetical protein [Sphingomonas sp. PB4P5]|uniref:pPIWI-associating nuclease domain-containing protein n=1 Tax=Parasphingomonas puruogangriensis TaxID=3096155 RepID=UPI002FC9A930